MFTLIWDACGVCSYQFSMYVHMCVMCTAAYMCGAHVCSIYVHDVTYVMCTSDCVHVCICGVYTHNGVVSLRSESGCCTKVQLNANSHLLSRPSHGHIGFSLV